MARLLMCRPDFYGIRYEINPWMRTSRGAVAAQARAQWEALHTLLTRRLGVTIDLIDPSPDWPDLVFTANAGLVVGRQFVVSNFRYPQRAGEACLFWDWFGRAGYTRIALPIAQFFEGEGDALFCGETLFCGYRFRSDVNSHKYLSQKLDCLGGFATHIVSFCHHRILGNCILRAPILQEQVTNQRVEWQVGWGIGERIKGFIHC